MKLKYIIATLLAGATLFCACENEADHYLSEVKVEKSFVSFPAAGGDVAFKFTTTDSWELKNLPDWITSSKTTGAAGENSVTLTATAATETREATFNIVCAGKAQNVNAIQMTEKVERQITPIATVISTASGTFRVKGIVTKVVNTQYGNFYMNDDSYTGSDFQIYGTKVDGAYPKDHPKGWAAFDIEVGDVITVEGPYSLYNTTHELVDVEIIAHEKSLIKVESVEPALLPAEGGNVEVAISSKVSPIILSTDVDWLKVTDVKEGGVYVLTAEANDYTAVRSATITVKGPGAIATKEVKQEGLPATGATVTEIIAMDDNSEIETLESTVIAKTTKGVVISDGANAIYVYGTKVDDVKVGDNVKIIAKKTSYNGVPEIVFTNDNAAHTVIVYSSDNKFDNPTPADITANAGEYTASKAEYIKLTGTLSVSGNYYNLALDAFPGGEKQGSIVAPVDDLNAASFKDKKITVTGWFNGLSSQGKFINIIATKIVEFEDNPKGTLTNPYTPSEIATLLVGGTTFSENVYIKGIVSRKTTYNYSATYNNASFWISDDGVAYGISEDGKKTTEPTKDFECYSVYWLGGDLSNPTAAADIKGNFEVGDEVVIYGAVTFYAGSSIAETQKNKAKIYSINGAETDENGVGNASYPFNVAGIEAFIDRAVAAKAAAAASELPEPTFPDVCVKGKISAILYAFDTSHENGTFWISDDGVAYGISSDKKKTTEPAKDFECYNVYWLNNVRWAEGDAQPAVGDEVIIKGQYTLYGTTYETAGKKAWVYSHTPASN